MMTIIHEQDEDDSKEFYDDYARKLKAYHLELMDMCGYYFPLVSVELDGWRGKYGEDVNHFKATPRNPFHVSVGAIIKNGVGEYLLINKNANASSDRQYSFMTGTIDANESPETTLHRELLEEMGAISEIVRFAGSTITRATSECDLKFTFQKCTLWYEVELKSFDVNNATDLQGSVEFLSLDSIEPSTKDLDRWPEWLLT